MLGEFFFAFGGGVSWFWLLWPFLVFIGLLAFPLCGGHLFFFAHQVDFLRGAGRKEKQPYWKSSGDRLPKVEPAGDREHFARARRPRDLHD